MRCECTHKRLQNEAVVAVPVYATVRVGASKPRRDVEAWEMPVTVTLPPFVPRSRAEYKVAWNLVTTAL
jgi:hypothetical protein